MRWDLRRILLATLVTWTGIRLTDVALPLITLQQTGSVWATGLVAGCAGVASLTSPWWGARLRHRLTSGRGLAAVFGVQATGHASGRGGRLRGSPHRVALGGQRPHGRWAAALGVPATRSVLADIGDRMGPGVAVRALAWQDFAHRISMVASPPVAAWLVTQHGAMPLMWLDALGRVAGCGHRLPGASLRSATPRGRIRLPPGTRRVARAPGGGGRHRHGCRGLVLLVRLRAGPGHAGRGDRSSRGCSSQPGWPDTGSGPWPVPSPHRSS